MPSSTTASMHYACSLYVIIAHDNLRSSMASGVRGVRVGTEMTGRNLVEDLPPYLHPERIVWSGLYEPLIPLNQVPFKP